MEGNKTLRNIMEQHEKVIVQQNILKQDFIILLGFSTERRQVIQDLDMLIIADIMAMELHVFRGQVYQLKTQEGYKETATLLHQECLRVDGFRFVVLLIGRADFWLPDREFHENVGDCIEAVRQQNDDAVIVLCATLPSLNDNKHTIRVASERNTYLSLLAVEGPKLQYSKPGKGLFVSGGPFKVFYKETGNLNDAGLELVRHGIENKFRCANLRGRQS